MPTQGHSSERQAVKPGWRGTQSDRVAQPAHGAIIDALRHLTDVVHQEIGRSWTRCRRRGFTKRPSTAILIALGDKFIGAGVGCAKVNISQGKWVS